VIVAITGGTGFIGRKLVARHLALGDRVRVLTRRAAAEVPFGEAVALFRGDLASGGDILAPFAEGASLLYHCAGELRDPARMHAVHVEGTRRLLAAAGRTIGRWVQLSSVGAYGPRNSGVVTEETPLRPRGVYEETKAESDRLVLAAASSGLVFSMVRPSIVFGPEMTNRSLFQLIAMIDRGLFFFIGEPGARANYIYVDNVVEGLVRCGTVPSAANRIYNLTDCRTLESFIGTIARALGRPVPTRRLPERPVRWAARLAGRLPRVPLTEARVAALVNRASYSTARIEHEVGYAHPVSMEEGLRQVVAAWRVRRETGKR
jgi:nucleoside-diphosphate-sugar epimerase